METNTEVDAAWERLCDAMLARHPEMTPGKMMTADALTLGGKVVVFRSRRNGHGLGCKIVGSDPGAHGAGDWKPLKPWADKAAMRDWYVVGLGEDWMRIAEAALESAREVAE